MVALLHLETSRYVVMRLYGSPTRIYSYKMYYHHRARHMPVYNNNNMYAVGGPG